MIKAYQIVNEYKIPIDTPVISLRPDISFTDTFDLKLAIKESSQLPHFCFKKSDVDSYLKAVDCVQFFRVKHLQDLIDGILKEERVVNYLLKNCRPLSKGMYKIHWDIIR